MNFLYSIFFLLCFCVADAKADEYVNVSAEACEKIMQNESKASTRLKASDKATFIAVKKISDLAGDYKVLSDHDFNVMIYRIVDDHIEDLIVHTTRDGENKICVEIKGRVLKKNIHSVRHEFIDDKVEKKDETEAVAQIVEDVKKEVSIKPNNPENLALVHVKNLEYFNGTKSVKYANLLKKYIENNPYFYLTEDIEIADYVITPKVLKAKVDALDAGNKRLHMALVLEVAGLEKEIISEYQNRFVLFGVEEDNQNTASRLLSKLIEQAGDVVVRKIEHKEQEKLETRELGRTLNK